MTTRFKAGIVKPNTRYVLHISKYNTEDRAIRNVKKDLLGQPLQLLSRVDILGNASRHMSQGIAALSMDKKFIQSRQRQENKSVEDFGGIIKKGGGALAKGLFRGVTCILTKPLESAKSSGVKGFVSGFGKRNYWCCSPACERSSGSSVEETEGANALRMKIVAAITSDEQLSVGDSQELLVLIACFVLTMNTEHRDRYNLYS